MTETVIHAFSGLGIFLFGMLYMETALKDAAGLRFKSWVKNSTSTTFKALLTGAGATAILQSSSVVTLMTLSFVSAALMSLKSGIAVIFGSNVGTTATAWIVALLGFNVKIDAFALPMIGIGSLMLIFANTNQKLGSIAKVLIGFGMLFFGLDIMKSAIESFAHMIDLATFANYPLIVFIAIGFVVTALIQSSSAAIAIILSALYANILTFEQSAAMVIGTNIGTTVTAILGAIGGIPDKKRAALAHLLFNLITAGVAFLLLPFMSYLLMRYMHSDPTTALALFQTLFNLLGVVMLTPFIGLLARLLNRMFVSNKAVPTRYIHLVDPKVPDTAFIALRNEVSYLFVKSVKYGLLLMNIKPSDLLVKNMDPEALVTTNRTIMDFDYIRAYDVIKEMEISIVEFTALLNQQSLTVEQSESIDALLTSVRESVYAAKILKDIKFDIDSFASSDNQHILNIYNSIRKNLAYAAIIFKHHMDEEWSIEKCHEKFAVAVEANHQIMKEATLSVGMAGVNEKMAISLLNTNRSIFIASQSLLEASNVVNLHFDLETD
jgi:phosphate:Na+ symporter